MKKSRQGKKEKKNVIKYVKRERRGKLRGEDERGEK